MKFSEPFAVLLFACLPAMAAIASATPPVARDDLVAADYRQGRLAFQQRCSACHTLAEGGANLIGPNLWDVMGTKAGSVGGFPSSDALKAAGFEWNPARMWHFLTDPKGYIPGNAMPIPEPVREQDRTALSAFLMLETGGADWPMPEVATATAPEDAGKPLAERFPSFWNHLMTNTSRYRMVTPGGELRFDVYFNTDGSVTASDKPIRGFWHVDERDFFCYALYGIKTKPSQLVECFPVVAMSIPRFAEELWASNPVEGVTLHGGIVPGRPDSP